ncbi:MAG: iron chelate uptake ABC transporter family permease subunit [Acidobacteriota bacterium]
MALALEVLLPPFVACLVLMGIHTYLGLHVVSRGVIFVDLALAQIAALGATFAFLLGFDPRGPAGYLYSLLFAFIGAAIFSILRLRDQRIPQEAIIGITFAVASASVILIADRAPEGAEFVEAMLTGMLLWVSWSLILTTAIVYSLIGLFHWYLRRRFLTLSLDPERARAEGWRVRLWDFLFYTSFGLVITYSVPMAGILLVFSFLIIPIVIAMLFAKSIAARLAIGWTVGTLVSMVGLSLSYAYDFPSGPAVVCTFGLALVLAGVARYLISAQRRVWAGLKVGATTAVAVVGLWLAGSTAPVPPARGAEGLASKEEARLEELVAVDPAERAARALAVLEGSISEGGEPPADAIAALLSVREELHRLMVTGKIKVSEASVEALARVQRDGAVGELLEEIAYHASDPWVRLRGADALVARGNVLGIEALIELLEADPPVFLQLQAAESLREATGQDPGFDPQAGAEAKARAVAKWRAWWDAHRGEPLAESAPTR